VGNGGSFFWFGFSLMILDLEFGFSWNNGLREAVVSNVVFVFEHFFYSVLQVSYKLLNGLSITIVVRNLTNLCITYN
jgi:hypothetical protein